MIKYRIPEGYRICAENVYAKHSLLYSALPSYFLLFSVWKELTYASHGMRQRIGRIVWGLQRFPFYTRGYGMKMTSDLFCYNRFIKGKAET
ncbi:RNA ligase family protein [Paenibacillus glucanolyticus]